MTDRTDEIRGRFAEAETVAPADLGDASAPDAGPIDPRTPTGTAGDPPRGSIESGDLGLPEIEGAKFPLNDTGNGLRFAHYCGDWAMYVPRVGWHVWDGRRWRLDPDGISVRRHAQSIHEYIEKEVLHVPLRGAEQRALDGIEQIRAELSDFDVLHAAKSAEDQAKRRQELITKKDDLTASLWGRGSTRQRHITFAKSAGNSGSIKNMLQEAITSLHREVDDLDADPLTINTLTGLLRVTVTDMRAEGAGRVAEVAIEDHARAAAISGRNATQHITKMMPVEYDPNARCPKFDRFLERVQPDPDMRAFLQRWFGLSLTAMPVQKFLYCYGMGANGKSVLAGLMRRMLGDYATMVKIESLTGKNRSSGSDATPDLMRLIGARAAITNEPEEGERLQEQKVKEMTGGDEMLVRNLHSDFVSFTPYFKLTFTGNHKLEIRGTDDGIWRRPLLCPFDVQIPEHERDETLGDQMFDEERAGILNWMLAGLIDYLEAGLQEPAAVTQATEEYRKDSDPIGDFLATACDIAGDSAFTSARDLVDACYLYLLENTAHAWKPGNLSRKLKERSGKYMHPRSGKTFARHKKNGVWGYTGIELTADMAQRLKDAPRDAGNLPKAAQSDGASGAGYDRSGYDRG